jgi:manganese/iron transport system permease protein
MHWLFDPLAYEFMRIALTAGLLLGILCPIVGTYLVVQQMALLGDVVAHAVLPGLVIAHFWGLPLILGAFVSGLLSTFLITWIDEQSRLKGETAMALMFASFFSLGIILLTKLQSRLDLEGLLFGNILSATRSDVVEIGLILAGIMVLLKLFYKELLFLSFDGEGAQAIGLPIRWLNGGLMSAITLAIVAGIKLVGVILVVALMVGPAATAYLLVTELHWMMVVGAGFGVLATIGGLYGSFYWDLPSGPTIALTIFVIFGLVLLWSPSQGILMRKIK